MMAGLAFNWRGTWDELKDLDALYAKCAGNTEGCEYMGRYSSWQAPYNFTYFYKVETMGKLQEALESVDFDRDYNKMTNAILEFWSGPL